jgi:NAD(P)-dependent dehydrogenase (short-subunit alcohol dehydrogenase family)
MDNPVVLITGALTGIGRATAVAFAAEGARATSSPAAMRRQAKRLQPNCATSASRPRSSKPMSAGRTR